MASRGQKLVELARNLFDEQNNETECFEDSEDDSDEDILEQQEDDSETNQEGDSSDESDIEWQSSENCFLGRDRITKWKKFVPNKNVRTRSQNIITRLPGVIRDAKKAKTENECWSCFIDDSMLNLIILHTNAYIESVRENFSRDRDAQHITKIELKAFLGILYLAGVLRSNRQSLEDLWATDGMGVELFRLVMSLRRFKFILRCLRLDDKETRTERKAADKLAAVREIFDMFVSNCKKNYSLGQNVTIDEKLEGFRGRCSFRQYIPSKPARYGIKIFALVDAKVFYTANLEIYEGLQPEGPYKVSNRPVDVVKRLAEPIFGRGRNITADNWFTDFDLIEYLRNKKLSYVGTVRKNKRQVPQEFTQVENRPVKSSMFGFREGVTLVSYVPKKNKCVLLASSMHFDDVLDLDTGAEMKPEIITYYNSTKSGVDLVDQMCSTYNCARNTCRWPMVVFFSMLNVAAINAQVIFLGNGNEVKSRRQFLKNLVNSLVKELLSSRAEKSVGMPISLRKSVQQFLEKPETNENRDNNNGMGKRKRCTECYSTNKKTRLSKYVCHKCKKSMCLQHADFICNGCIQVYQNDKNNDQKVNFDDKE